MPPLQCDVLRGLYHRGQRQVPAVRQPDGGAGPPAGKRPELPEGFKKVLQQLGEGRPLPPVPKPEPTAAVRQQAAELARANKMPPWIAEKYPEELVSGIAAQEDFRQACLQLVQTLGAPPGGRPAAAAVQAAAVLAVADVMAADCPGLARPMLDGLAKSAAEVAFVKAALEALAPGLAGPVPRPALEETRRALVESAAALGFAPFSLYGGESCDPKGAARRCSERTMRFRQAVQTVAAARQPTPAAAAAGELVVKVRCPKCHAEYAVAESKLGKRARCGKTGCGHSFLLGITESAG
ncbi:MAG: MJ0042-type zinc finger domain-containing protein [Gemmataceae bacterium]